MMLIQFFLCFVSGVLLESQNNWMIVCGYKIQHVSDCVCLVLLAHKVYIHIQLVFSLVFKH